MREVRVITPSYFVMEIRGSEKHLLGNYSQEVEVNVC